MKDRMATAEGGGGGGLWPDQRGCSGVGVLFFIFQVDNINEFNNIK